MPIQTYTARFWSNVSFKWGGDACWEWTRPPGSHGYGTFYYNKKSRMLAHRMAYTLVRGEFDTSLFVLHRCDNRICVNPSHLFLGTAKQNSEDMCQKLRHPRGECRPNAKLSPEAILRIRSGDIPSRLLALEYSVTPQHIDKIRRFEQWKHVKSL
jgi:hypothetical protein